MPEPTRARTVSLTGEMTIRNAARIQANLGELVQRHSDLRLDCSRIAEVDVSFLQLLLAARKTAVAAGRTLTLVGCAGTPLHEAAQRAGLLTSPANADDGDRSFWLENPMETADGQDHPHRG